MNITQVSFEYWRNGWLLVQNDIKNKVVDEILGRYLGDIYIKTRSYLRKIQLLVLKYRSNLVILTLKIENFLYENNQRLWL